MQLKEIEKISKALGDVNRLKILMHMQANHGRMECMELANILNLAQPSISHHIKKLTEADLIESQKVGRFHHYILNKRLLREYSKAIHAVNG